MEMHMPDKYWLTRAASLLRKVPDFPKPGILFFDLNPVLRDQAVMDYITTDIASHWKPLNIDVVAGFDSRGFLFGPLVAERLGVPFTMIRKKGKLPPPVRSVSYGLEYGTDVIEMADDGFIADKRVLLIDDLLATGGTAGAGVELVELLGGVVVGFTCMSEIPALGGRGKLMRIPVYSLITIMDGEALIDAEYCVDMCACSTDGSNLILIERLAEVPGLAMPGGRIEMHESALDAAMREMREEVGVTPTDWQYHTTLTGLNRDPRGPKVSVVFTCTTHGDASRLMGEDGKTRPLVVPHRDQLPAAHRFVLGHGQFIYANWDT